MRGSATLCVLCSVGLLALGAAAQPAEPGQPPTGTLPPVGPTAEQPPAQPPPPPPAPSAQPSALPPEAAPPVQPQPQAQPQQQPLPPQPQPYPPGYASPAEQPPAAAGPTPLEKWLERSGIVPVFSVGFILGGSGEVEEDCEASGTPTSIDAPACSDDGFSESIDYKDESGMVLRTDLLFPVSSRVRIGPGAMLVLDPTYEIELGPFGNIKYETGTELSLFGAVDAVFPTGETLGLIVRGQLGLTALFAGEDHADAIDSFREECRASTYETCDTREGPFFAPHIGVGFGLLLQASNIALRVELLGQYKRQPFWHTEVSGSGVSRTMDGTFAGTRSVLLVGLEL